MPAATVAPKLGTCDLLNVEQQRKGYVTKYTRTGEL